MPRPARTRPLWWDLATAAVFLVAAIGVWRWGTNTTTEVTTDADEVVVGEVAALFRPRPTVTAPPPPPAATRSDELPIPEPLPADAFAPTPQVILGTVELPTLGVTGSLQEGITLTAINRGPGHWPGTPQPGDLGNMVVAGHRTTWSKPFANLDRLNPGDHVIFTTAAGAFTYEVRGVIIVPAVNIGIAAQSRAHTATLFACHPRGQATHRIVAKLRLLNPDGTPTDPESALPPVDQGSDPTTDTTLTVRKASGPVENAVVDTGVDPLSAGGGG